MKPILDTHTFLYFIDGNPKLSTSARTLIENIHNENLISKASLWEMAIKISLGKLLIGGGGTFDVVIPQEIRKNGFHLLNIEMEHVSLVVSLPFHHKDPFDRMLIAQSIAESFPIVSADGAFDSYPVNRLW